MDWSSKWYQNSSDNNSLNKTTSIKALSSLEACKYQQIWNIKELKISDHQRQHVLMRRVRTRTKRWVQYARNQTYSFRLTKTDPLRFLKLNIHKKGTSLQLPNQSLINITIKAQTKPPKAYENKQPVAIKNRWTNNQRHNCDGAATNTHKAT